MEYIVFVQNSFYKTMSARNTGAALIQTIKDIKNGLVPHFNAQQPNKITIGVVESAPPS